MSIAPTPKTAEDPDDNHRPLLDTEALLHRDDKQASRVRRPSLPQVAHSSSPRPASPCCLAWDVVKGASRGQTAAGSTQQLPELSGSADNALTTTALAFRRPCCAGPAAGTRDRFSGEQTVPWLPRIYSERLEPPVRSRVF
jgi:hypothetical protein